MSDLTRPLGYVFLTVGILALVSACQTTMSVEEAKKITESFSATSFIPPPRTIDDITAILDQQKRANPERAARAKTQADREPPKTNNPTRLAGFYYERGLAAREIGRAKQEIADLTAAREWSQRAGGGVSYEDLVYELALAEITSGDITRAETYLGEVILVPGAVAFRYMNLIRGHTMLARLYAGAGRFDAAEAAIQVAQAMLTNALTQIAPNVYNRDRPSPELIAFWNANVSDALAWLAELRGHNAEAERLYRETLATFLSNPITAKLRLVDSVRSRLALTLMRQGRVVEAEKEARAALLSVLAKDGRYSPHTANTLITLVSVILAQGRYAETETLARAVLDIHDKVGTSAESPQLAFARTQLGDALVAQERWTDALVQFEKIPRAATGFEAYQTASGNAGWVLALLGTGQTEQALALLDVSIERKQRLLGETHRVTAELRGLRAMVHAKRGDQALALREFGQVIPILLTPSQATDDDEAASRPAQDHRLRTILTAYIGLLADISGAPLEREVGIDAASEAFRLADVARGRQVQRALDAGAARAAARAPALADLVRREQDAKKQSGALLALLASVMSLPTDKQDRQAVDSLRSRIETLRRARQSLAVQIEKEFPAYAELISPKPATVEQVRGKLRAGEALVATYVADDRTFVWAVPQSGEILFAAVQVGDKAMAASVEMLRKALDPSAKTLGEIPAFDLAVAHRLFKTVLEPVARVWQQAESLLVVAHGPLAQLPFSLLPTKPTTLGPEDGTLFSNYRAVPWLARTHAVTVLPSVTALTTLRGLPSGDPNRRPFVGFGDPYFSHDQARRAAAEPTQQVAALTARGVPITLRNLKVEKLNSNQLSILPRLPDTADEIKGIALAMRADMSRDVFLGDKANEQQVKSMDLAGYRVLAFATHGLVPGDLDGLTQPALALTAPEVAKIQGDGLLTMEEILSLRLNADWVVLSACNTASGQGAGSEAISGLGRAFFYAGARALLVSNWPVETNSARDLTTDLFRRQSANPRLTRAKALQETMNALIDGPGFVDSRTKQVVFSYAHPIFWAPFALVGDGGGN